MNVVVVVDGQLLFVSTSKSRTSSLVSSVPLRLPTAQTSLVSLARIRHTTPPDPPLSNATRLRMNSPVRTSQSFTVPSSEDVITNRLLNCRQVTADWCLLGPVTKTSHNMFINISFYIYLPLMTFHRTQSLQNQFSCEGFSSDLRLEPSTNIKILIFKKLIKNNQVKIDEQFWNVYIRMCKINYYLHFYLITNNSNKYL